MEEHLETSSKERGWRVVVDECVGPKSILFQQFKKHFSSDRLLEFVYLSAAHRAIPDPEILRKVLSRDTILLTTDRVLHSRFSQANRCLAQREPAGPFDSKPETNEHSE